MRVPGGKAEAVCHHHVLGDGTNSIHTFVDILIWIFIFFSVLLSIVNFFLFNINPNVFPMQQSVLVKAGSAGDQEMALVF